MNKLKKFVAGITTIALAATMASCSAPTIGAGSATAVTIDGYEVPAGVFLYYTISNYYSAQQILYSENGTAPTVKELKSSHIDNVEASEWIQNKATEYCTIWVAVEKEFDKIGGQLSDEEKEEIETNLDSALSGDNSMIYTENGISEDSLRLVLESEYKRDHVFDYYYGFESEKGCSEEELKDYFDENYARVKYIKLSTLDADGEELEASEKHEILKMAESYADEINKESKIEDKLAKADEIQEKYDEYEAEKKAEAEAAEAEANGETVTTTTTTTTTTNETTTTTTTDPHANERILPRVTTTAASDNEDNGAVTGTTTTTAPDTLAPLKNYIFDELEYDTAKVFEDEENDAVYVVIRADLKERMTDDDLWSEDYIKYMQSLRYEEDFQDYITELADGYTVNRNKSAYRRYDPFELYIETQSQ